MNSFAETEDLEDLEHNIAVLAESTNEAYRMLRSNMMNVLEETQEFLRNNGDRLDDEERKNIIVRYHQYQNAMESLLNYFQNLTSSEIVNGQIQGKLKIMIAAIEYYRSAQ